MPLDLSNLTQQIRNMEREAPSSREDDRYGVEAAVLALSQAADDLERLRAQIRVAFSADRGLRVAEPLPEPPDWKSPERQLALEPRLVELAMSQGITVERKQLNGSTQGLSRHGVIELAEEAGTKALIHEIAHELLHWGGGEKVDRQTEELEA